MSISQKKGRKGKGGTAYKHELTLIRKVVQDYLEGTESRTQVAERYGVTLSCVGEWLKKYRRGLHPFEAVSLPSIPMEQSQSDQTELQKQNEELLKKLHEANLKITGLEIMIDIAEEQLGVEIRKKSGTRQSKDCATTTPKKA
jgi:transposase-like protein